MKQYKMYPKAIYIGLACFVILYFCLLLIQHYFIPLVTFQSKSLLALILGFLFILFSGFVAGVIAKQDYWFNGFMVGLVGAIIVSIIDLIVNPSLMSTIYLFLPMRVLQTVILCSFGGFLSGLYLKQQRVA